MICFYHMTIRLASVILLFFEGDMGYKRMRTRKGEHSSSERKIEYTETIVAGSVGL
jgi:hypothetical protein